jgi:ubiquinone/menaquinone biosynthesis C-methylase UbiE
MAEFGCRVTGIDLVDEYIRAARMMDARIGYGSRITFARGNGLEMPFAENSFGVVFAQHVMMNVADKARLAREIRRVLWPGGRLGLYEICAGTVSPPYYPLLWAGDKAISFLVEAHTLRQVFEKSGFATIAWRDVTTSSLEWNQQLVADHAAGLAPLGLELLMGATTATKMRNMMMSLQENRIKVIEGLMILTG